MRLLVFVAGVVLGAAAAALFVSLASRTADIDPYDSWRGEDPGVHFLSSFISDRQARELIEDGYLGGWRTQQIHDLLASGLADPDGGAR